MDRAAKNSTADVKNPKTRRKHPFSILSINISTKRGIPKTPIAEATLIRGFGIQGDAHGGEKIRQISLLANEDVDTQRGKGMELHPGDFAENITTQGIPLPDLPIGTTLYMGDAILEISKIGKECHQHCAIYHTTGDCVMPRRGVFAIVIQEGVISHESNCYYYL